DVLIALGLDPALRERVVRAVGDHREHLDRRHRGGLQPGEPAERGPRGTAERVVREARRTARDRVHTAQLGVRQREDRDRDTTDDPGDDRRWAGGGQGALRAEKPTGADDRALRRPDQADETDVAPKSGPALLCGGLCSGDSHTRTMSPARLPCSNAGWSPGPP